MVKRACRSTSYQQIFAETLCGIELLETFCNEDSISFKLNPFKYDERLLDLEDRLKVAFWRIVDTLLTPRQKAVIKLYADGYTQMEIAKMLNVNQSSITKSLNGNVDYKKGRKAYGGTKKKIKKILENDEEIKEILKEMEQLRVERW